MGLAFLITTDNLQLLSERKVLKEAEYAALLDATQVIRVAQDEAQRVARQAEAAAAQRERTGYEEGLQRAKAEYAQRLVSEAMAAERQLRALRESMAAIVVKAIGQFMADADPAAQFKAALLRVDSLIRREPFVTVRVAPMHESVLRELVEQLRDEARWSMTLAIQADPALSDGACVLHTASGTLEIGIDAQLEAIRKAVERGGAAR
jgi:type III secretion protein L